MSETPAVGTGTKKVASARAPFWLAWSSDEYAELLVSEPAGRDGERCRRQSRGSSARSDEGSVWDYLAAQGVYSA